MKIGGEPDALHLRCRVGACARLLVAIQTQHCAGDAGGSTQIGAKRDVVQDRHRRNQLDVLKGAAQT